MTTREWNRGTVTLIDPNENEHRFEVDVFGQVQRRIELPEGSGGPEWITSYDYDQGGRLTRVDPAAPDAGEPSVGPTVISYDPLGRRRSINDPDVGKSTFEWDPAGNPICETDARGITIVNEFDALDRLDRSGVRMFPGGSTTWDVDYRYDEAALTPNALGRLTSVSDAAGLHRWTYDAKGRTTKEEHEVDGTMLPFSQSYNGLDELLTRVFPAATSGTPSAEHSYTRDAFGYPTGVRDERTGISFVADYHADATGRPRRIRAGNGVESETRYDPTTNLLQAVRIYRGQATISDLTYSIDNAGRLGQISDGRLEGRDRDFEHDALDRLTQASGPYGSAFAQVSLGYDYDKYGNLRLKDGISRAYGEVGTRADSLPGMLRPHAPRTVGTTTLSYDDAGNLVSDGTRTFGWDGRGRLSTVVAGSQFLANTFDHTNRRVRSVTEDETRWFVTDDFEWDGSKATIHVFFEGRRVASREFDFTPVLVAARISPEPPDTSDWALALVLFAAPPGGLVFLVVLTWLVEDRRLVTVRVVQATLAAVVLLAPIRE